MSEERIYSYEPLWGSWWVDGVLGEGSFGMVYRVYRDDLGERIYSAVKVISISQNDGQLSELCAAGMSQETMRGYCQSFVHEIIGELGLMQKFRGNSNIVSYEDHFVVEREDIIGADIVLRMELLTPLNNYINQKGFYVSDVVTMGIDLCHALELCAMHSIVHRDIKPGNIFISDAGSYKLGDFGIARSIEKGTGELSKKGTYSYMAPEVYQGSPYDATIDLYSLGIVMYRLLNSYRLPFLPLPPASIDYGDNEKALSKRLGGYPMPRPIAAPEPLAKIVLKACDYRPENRFSSPAELRAALENIMERIRSGEIANYAVLAPGDTPYTVMMPRRSDSAPPPSYQQEPPAEPAKPSSEQKGSKRTAGASLSPAEKKEGYSVEKKKKSKNKRTYSGKLGGVWAKIADSPPVLAITDIFEGFTNPKNLRRNLISLIATLIAIGAIVFSVMYVARPTGNTKTEVTEKAVVGKWVSDDGEYFFDFGKNGTLYTRNSDWETTIGVFQVLGGDTIMVTSSGKTVKYSAVLKGDRLTLTSDDKNYVLLRETNKK
ncbi:MAG: serine/threonine protein kinase [Clostridia bacterium]|nr:serine/threonine protein kinase [Clostridia bacterium]